MAGREGRKRPPPDGISPTEAKGKRGKNNQGHSRRERESNGMKPGHRGRDGKGHRKVHGMHTDSHHTLIILIIIIIIIIIIINN